jgi:hypothetical protein
MDLWRNGTHAIFDIRVTHLDNPSSMKRTTDQILKYHEKEKKNKYLQDCIEQRRDFTPFVVSTDGCIGEEGKKALKRIAARLSARWNKPYSQTLAFVNARMSIAIARTTHLCLRGSRIPMHLISNRVQQWEDGAGLCLW